MGAPAQPEDIRKDVYTLLSASMLASGRLKDTSCGPTGGSLTTCLHNESGGHPITRKTQTVCGSCADILFALCMPNLPVGRHIDG